MPWAAKKRSERIKPAWNLRVPAVRTPRLRWPVAETRTTTEQPLAELFPHTGKARIVGLTGPPGVGKSTLIGALTKELRGEERDVGVLSIDPSSPFTQGAVLGDR